VVAIAVLVLILVLVGRRRMREEYSVLWILAGSAMVVFAILGPNAERFFGLLGIESVLNALLFFGVIFLVVVNIYASVKISAITNRMKELIQYIALLEGTRPSANGHEPPTAVERTAASPPTREP
jgi:hypothetical protein